MSNDVSVIIPTFNRDQFIKKAVESVLDQSYDNFELIIVDDGSTDKTREILTGYGKNIIYIQQSNRGPSAARNVGIKAARHSLIAFLDSDDWFDKTKLEVQAHAMASDPEYLISHTGEIWYRNGRLLNQKKRHRKHSGYIFQKCLELCAVGMSTIMVRKEIFDRIGCFDESMRCCEDYDLWLRASVKHKFLLIDKPLTYKQGGHEDQVSRRFRIGMDKFRIQSILKVLRSGILSRDQEISARKELAKKCLVYGKGCLKHGKPEEGAYYLQFVPESSVELDI